MQKSGGLHQALGTNDGEDGHPGADKSFSYLEFLFIGSFWFGWSFVWMPLVAVMIPRQLSTIVDDDHKGFKMNQAFLLGSIGSMVLSPLFGFMSDRSRKKMGRRRPFIILGCGISTVGLIAMGTSPPLVWFCISFLVLSLGNFIALAPYLALIPDVVPENQRGKACGCITAMSMIGFLAGGWLTYYLESYGVLFIYLLMVVVFVGSAYITVNFVPEVRVAVTPSEFYVKECILALFEAFRDKDFFWVVSSRFFIQMGCVALQMKLQYYLEDSLSEDYSVLGVTLAMNAAEALAVLFVPLLSGAVVSSVFAGYISDFRGGQRKQLIYISGGTMAAVTVLLGLSNIFFFDIILALVFGFGFGVFSTINWALVTDVLPNSDTYGKDMGLWNLAFTLQRVVIAPLVITPLTGVSIVYMDDQSQLEWFIVFMVVSVSFVIGTYLVRKVSNIK